ncbi:galactokinase [Frankia sp. AgB1.9]|uniref:galactokinase n=1 Tax=unclassified Frankia TaxID=2632575 RepID=UPI001932CD0E|nr:MULTISPECIES: galactokinase [unclassified Frankia]MBL7487545.1 galactokinase [Frankia sp. AgW1.1]MBL7549516.1 galactokinase [Frankia sp. AgB1.9]MBL7620695.1 galactokinase [Frankia sp. AgB1.8]
MTDRTALAAHLAARFQDFVGRPAAGVWAAPGRVNLMGEHTDYNDGLVLPFAIDSAALVAVAPRVDDRLTCRSLDRPDVAAIHAGDLAPGSITGWPAYVLGAVWALGWPQAGRPGLDIVVTSDVPAGAGLSSSAALTCAVTLAAAEIAGLELDRTALATAARRAETDMVGAPVGIMDQMAAMYGQAGHALLLDCRSLVVEPVVLPGQESDAAVLVVDTRVSHANSEGGYARRRAVCERAARRLGVPALRDATLTAVETALEGDELRVARHVVTEIERVGTAVAALRRADLASLGEIFAASHASMRDDFRISCAELDLAVDALLGAGAVAARMTGGGFGGCAVGLLPPAAVPAATVATTAAFEARGFTSPRVFETRPSGGAARIR